MGDTADLMLNGTLCECCGVYLAGEADGIPRRCKDCWKEANLEAHQNYLATHRKTKCPTCGKKVREVGLDNHMRDAHGVGK